jgi:hypothetical protein
MSRRPLPKTNSWILTTSSCCWNLSRPVTTRLGWKCVFQISLNPQDTSVFVGLSSPSGMFEKGVDAFLVLNAVAIGIQSYPELAGQIVVLDRKYWDGSIYTFRKFIENVLSTCWSLTTAPNAKWALKPSPNQSEYGSSFWPFTFSAWCS